MFAVPQKNPVGIAVRVFYCLIIHICLSSSSLATPLSPFPSRDQNPFTLIFGLPIPVSAALTASGKQSFSSTLNLSNTINLQQNASEQLFVDVESYQLSLSLNIPLTNDWLFTIEPSFIYYGSGFMDNWINDYHQLMGLPEGIRPSLPAEQFTIDYQLNGEPLVNIRQSASAIGDLNLKLAYQVDTADNSKLSLWTSLKLPTGSSQKLSGSGAMDIALWAAYDQHFGNGSGGFINGGILLLGRGDILPSLQRRSVLFTTAGLQFHPWKPVLLKTQLDIHQKFFDSKLEFLGNVVQITFGGSLLINKNSRLDIAIAEDIQVAASPDVNFNISYTLQY